jgi:hypothetical protein
VKAGISYALELFKITADMRSLEYRILLSVAERVVSEKKPLPSSRDLITMSQAGERQSSKSRRHHQRPLAAEPR